MYLYYFYLFVCLSCIVSEATIALLLSIEIMIVICVSLYSPDFVFTIFVMFFYYVCFYCICVFVHCVLRRSLLWYLYWQWVVCCVSCELCVVVFVGFCFYYFFCTFVFFCILPPTLCFAAFPPLVIVLTGKAAPVGLVICVILTKFSPNQGKRPDNWMTGNSRSSLN